MITEEEAQAIVQKMQSLVTQFGFEGAILEVAKEYCLQAQCKVELIDICNQYCIQCCDENPEMLPKILRLAKEIEPSIAVILAPHKVGYIDLLVNECMSVFELDLLLQIAKDVVGGDLPAVFWSKIIDRKLVLVNPSESIN